MAIYKSFNQDMCYIFDKILLGKYTIAGGQTFTPNSDSPEINAILDTYCAT